MSCKCICMYVCNCVDRHMCGIHVRGTHCCMHRYKGRGPLGQSPKGYGVHREPRLPDCIRHGLPTRYAFSVLTRFSGACPSILGKQISNPRVCSGKSCLGEPHITSHHITKMCPYSIYQCILIVTCKWTRLIKV